MNTINCSDHDRCSVIMARTGRVELYERLVIKRLYDSGRAEEEYALLQELYDLFPLKELDRWQYRAVKPLSFDSDGSIFMERATGVPLDQLVGKYPDLLYQAGVWLALFHSGSRVRSGSDREVYLFGDFSMPHLVIDRSEKIVTAIDPGYSFGCRGAAEKDLYSFVIGLITFYLKRLKLPGSAVYRFLDGYYDNSRLTPDQKALDKAMEPVLEKYRQRWKKRNLVKKALSGFYLALLSFYGKRLNARYVKLRQ